MAAVYDVINQYTRYMVLKKKTSQCTIACDWTGDGVSEESEDGCVKISGRITCQLGHTAVIETKCGTSLLSQKNCHFTGTNTSNSVL